MANPTSSEATRDAMISGRIGFIDTPAQGNIRPAGVTWCADNGAFGKGYPGDQAFIAWLGAQHDRDNCLFATAPDALCDHQRTYRRSDRWIDSMHALGYRVAFVAQNGANSGNLPWGRFECLFIGGDDDFKLGQRARDLVAEAKRRGKWVHMGRVNSERRFRYASHIGCDSADGTFLTFGPDTNHPRLEAWLRGVTDQGDLFEGAA
jgi:hypothetical protein